MMWNCDCGCGWCEAVEFGSAYPEIPVLAVESTYGVITSMYGLRNTGQWTKATVPSEECMFLAHQASFVLGTMLTR